MIHEKRKNVCFQCPVSLYETFTDLVNQDERSLSWTMRKLIQRYVNEKSEEKKSGENNHA